MISVGTTYTLKVLKLVDFGAYLDAGNLGEVLLPRKYIPSNIQLHEQIEVFLYLDSEDRPVATTQKPLTQVGEFAFLKAIDNTPFGAFLDWGLEKNLLLPFSEQHKKIEVGHHYLVYVTINKADGRIIASSKIDKFIQDTNDQFKPKQKVELIIGNSTDLGYKAIINHSHWGLLYKNEVFKKLSFGQKMSGFIQAIRADGKIDLTLHGGLETRNQQAETILDYLSKHNGFAAVHDKSDPQLIQQLFNMSKGEFKKTIGGLYKQHLIDIETAGIRLLKKV